MQCGAACVTMVTRHYGKRFPLSYISSLCQPQKNGVSLKAIDDVLKSLGFNTFSCAITTGALCDNFSSPCILHWNQNHFVVLYGIRGKGKNFYVADPDKGRRVCSREDLGNYWESTTIDGKKCGIAMFIEPTEQFYSLPQSEETDRSSFRFLIGYLKQYRRYFAQIFLGLFLGCVLQLVLPFLTQSIIDVGIAHKDTGFIWLVLLGELAIVTGRTATDFIRRWLLLHISMRINISLVSDFFIKLLRLPMGFFDTKLMGDLLQRIGDHGRVQSFLTTQTLGVVFSALGFIVFGIVLLLYDTLVFGVFMCGSVIYGLWIAAFLRRRKALDYELFERQAVNQDRTYQFVTSMQEIKLQGCERRRRWEWEDTQADLFAVQMKSLKLKQTQEAGGIFINEAKNILVTVLTATAVIDGQMTLGMMLAVQYIIGQLNSPVEQLMGFLYSVQDVKISLERINEIHGSKEEEDSGRRAASFAPGSDRSVELRDVTFRYDPHAAKKTIDRVSFKIPQGKVTAIVGASGSGKTTLIKLILGYYPAQSGSVSIAGHDIGAYSLRWWRRQCGVVMQDGVIFSESIARNIAVGDGDIDRERLEAAARTACIHGYISGLPLKYDTRIGRDGIGLSQGQKQRILIARAVYKDPAYIFLDEATNSLDAKNEREIVENLDGFYRGRTVVVVAHRLSTVRNADQIIVLDGGRVVECGDHGSLIKNKGAYYNLVKNQLELGN